jgi:hypothetical protein
MVLGFGLLLGLPLTRTLRTLAETPPSAFVAGGLVPIMLIGQLLTTRKRSRR